MKKEDIYKAAAARNCIPGMFNYCDQWCKRCPLTSRCLTYLITAERDGGGSADSDPANEIFWRDLAGLLRMTLEMIRETAAEMGVDLDAIIDGDETGAHENDRDESVIHVIEHMAKNYADRVDAWFTNEYDMPEEKTPYPDLHLLDDRRPPHVVSAGDALEIIGWYRHQIYIKICRALNSSETEDMPVDDVNGSAKVALIGIDRSISAWGVLLQVFTGKKPEIVPLLNMLESLRLRLEAEFPEARGFKRPGFD